MKIKSYKELFQNVYAHGGCLIAKYHLLLGRQKSKFMSLAGFSVMIATGQKLQQNTSELMRK